MAGGRANPVMQNETDFVVLDGVMVLVASLCLTICTQDTASQDLATGENPQLGDAEKRVCETSLEAA
jgi:hypothetical protein